MTEEQRYALIEARCKDRLRPFDALPKAVREACSLCHYGLAESHYYYLLDMLRQGDSVDQLLLQVQKWQQQGQNIGIRKGHTLDLDQAPAKPTYTPRELNEQADSQ